jgi:hypothetical protein
MLARLPKRPLRRRFAYVVWGIVAAVILVPELYAAFAHDDVAWFTTISHTTGHLERHHVWVELAVVAIIVLAVYSAVKVPPKLPPETQTEPEAASGTDPDAQPEPGRTVGGRLTLKPQKQATAGQAKTFDGGEANKWLVVAVPFVLATIALSTWAAVKWWPDDDPSNPVHYHASYVLYGLIGIFWVIVPTAVALVWGHDFFPTFFRTVNNLEEAVRPYSPRGFPVGLAVAWFVAYATVAGLVILLLHLAFYPYPNITHILNPNG